MNNANPYGNVAGVINYASYQRDALATEKLLDGIYADKALLVAVLGVAISTGKLVDLLKKNVIYGKSITQDDYDDAIEKVIVAGTRAEDMLNRVVSEEYEGEDVTVNPRLLHAVLGGYSEKAELLELLRDQIIGKGLDPKKVVDEAGDGCWYQALELDEVSLLTGVAPAGVLAGNIAKLRARHGGGGFTLTTSENKDRDAEMDAVTKVSRQFS